MKTGKPWPDILDDSGLSNYAISRHLEAIGINYTPQAVGKLRRGETSDPGHSIAVNIIEICRAHGSQSARPDILRNSKTR